MQHFFPLQITVYALQQWHDTALVEMRASLHSHGSRHVGVLLEPLRTRNVDKYVVIYTSSALGLW